jgi:hypothetical protein
MLQYVDIHTPKFCEKKIYRLQQTPGQWTLHRLDVRFIDDKLSEVF